MRCGIHHTSFPKSSYSVFLFLSVFYVANILLSCYKDKFTDNIKAKLRFKLTLRHIKYHIVASQPHHTRKKNHVIVSVLAFVDVWLSDWPLNLHRLYQKLRYWTRFERLPKRTIIIQINITSHKIPYCGVTATPHAKKIISLSLYLQLWKFDCRTGPWICIDCIRGFGSEHASNGFQKEQFWRIRCQCFVHTRDCCYWKYVHASYRKNYGKILWWYSLTQYVYMWFSL